MTNETLEKANDLTALIKRVRDSKRTDSGSPFHEVLDKSFIPDGTLEQYQSNIDAEIDRLEKELADL